MIIDKAEVIVTSPDRNFVTLRLTTADGLTGLGNATLNGRESADVAYPTEHVVPLLIGSDASRIENTWQFLLHPGDKACLGVELNVDEAGKYPHEQAHLPSNRLQDGTVHDW